MTIIIRMSLKRLASIKSEAEIDKVILQGSLKLTSSYKRENQPFESFFLTVEENKEITTLNSKYFLESLLMLKCCYYFIVQR